MSLDDNIALDQARGLQGWDECSPAAFPAAFPDTPGGVSPAASPEASPIFNLSAGSRGYTRVDLVVDSGAFHSVIPPHVVDGIPLEPGDPSVLRSGRTAAGQTLNPKGRAVVTCDFDQGSPKTLDFLVMDVTRALGSVHQMVSRGCQVTFAPEADGGSYLLHKASGDRHRLFPRNGVYVLPIWIRRPGASRVKSEDYDGAVAALSDPAEAPAPLPRPDEALADPPEGEEAQAPKGLTQPPAPTPEMVREHNLTHLPFRPWCTACVRGRGKCEPHRRQTGQQSDLYPVFSMDYIAEHQAPVLVLFDRRSKGHWAHSLPCKGVGHPYAQWAVTRNLRMTGYRRIVLKSDNESSLVALARAIKGEWDGEIALENSPRYESRSNGEIERAIQTVSGLARTLKEALQMESGFSVPDASPLLAWLVDYAGVLTTLFHRGPDGYTPYQRLKGKAWKLPLPRFGETVEAFRRNSHCSKTRWEPRWVPGVFVGVNLYSSEKLIAAGDGIFPAQSLRLRPEPQAFDPALLAAICCAPWRWDPRPEERPELPAPILLRPTQPDVPPAPREPSATSAERGFYVTRRDLEDLGYTPGCPTCQDMQAGTRRTGTVHSDTCRARVIELVRRDPARRGRLEAAEARLSSRQLAVDATGRVRHPRQPGPSASPAARPRSDRPPRAPSPATERTPQPAGSSSDPAPAPTGYSLAGASKRTRPADPPEPGESKALRVTPVEAAPTALDDLMTPEAPGGAPGSPPTFDQPMGSDPADGPPAGPSPEPMDTDLHSLNWDRQSADAQIIAALAPLNAEATARDQLRDPARPVAEADDLWNHGPALWTWAQSADPDLWGPEGGDELALEDLGGALCNPWKEYRDTISGEALETQEVQRAMDEEAAYMRSLPVWTTLAAQDLLAGDKPVPCKWVFKKGPPVRARLVACEIRCFAPMRRSSQPPLPWRP